MIRIIDNSVISNPEDLAMLQALYSRSNHSVDLAIEKVKAAGSGKFMENYYVGYNHRSIGQTSSITIFFEGVSILAAKAIQDNSLYNGIETSSRYVDFSQQPLVGSDSSLSEIHTNLLDFYSASKGPLVDHLKTLYPKTEDQDQTVWERAIQSRAFDILRGFLPAGVTTQLSWHTSLDKAQEHLSLLLLHPLQEVKDLAKETLNMLVERYPSSFTLDFYTDEQASYYNDVAYSSTKAMSIFSRFYPGSYYRDASYMRYFNRPEGSLLPRFISNVGNFVYTFLLDFGSFRDVQRHRDGICRMPLLTTLYGFNDWYIYNLPISLQSKALTLISDIKEKLDTSNNVIGNQYYIPLGMNVLVEVTYSLRQAVYVSELRSKQAVHPTLRVIAQQMGRSIQDVFPDISLYVDYSDSTFCYYRGKQTIQEKQ